MSTLIIYIIYVEQGFFLQSKRGRKLRLLDYCFGLCISAFAFWCTDQKMNVIKESLILVLIGTRTA